MRVVFLGSDAIALPMLEWLATEREAVQVVAVFTQPDRAVGRGQKVQPNEVKVWAQARSIPVLQPEKLTAEVRVQLAGFAPDIALIMAYGHILRDEFIATPRLGTLNFHTSILPKYRGASPIQSAVAAGETETGVTLMRIVRRLDAGPVADVERVAIGQLDTAAEVEARLAVACVPLLARALPALVAGALPFREQDESAATYCRKLAREDGGLDFHAPAKVLAARINGLFPWPACRAEILGQVVKFGLADTMEPMGGVAVSAGVVVGADADGLLLGTGAGILRVRRLQRPGGKMLPASEFLRGFPIPPDLMLASQPMPSLAVPNKTLPTAP